jgi:hypothetical protein
MAPKNLQSTPAGAATAPELIYDTCGLSPEQLAELQAMEKA